MMTLAKAESYREPARRTAGRAVAEPAEAAVQAGTRQVPRHYPAAVRLRPTPVPAATAERAAERPLALALQQSRGEVPMFRSLHIAATGMAAQETHLETISNNISNGNTVGYKKQRVDFQDLLYQTVRAPGTATGQNTASPTGLQIGTGVRVVSTSRVFAQGTIQTTSNPLDLALEGEGFFVVQQSDGTPAYTRAGALRTSAEGQLVTPEGMPLEPPINIPEGTVSISIAANGTVSVSLPGETAPSEVGQIQTAAFVNPAGLQAIGHNLLVPTAASGEAQVGEPGTEGRGALLQGALEQSNVDIVEEMIGLISAQRSYEINSKVITTADEMLRAASQMR